MSPSPGVRPLVAALLLFATIATAEEAGRFDTAEQAVAARAWQEAARIWQREADAGEAEAYMGLGNLWDLGVLGRRDRELALAYYRKAAEAGLPAAAFNVAAMHATGSGTERDLVAAATWYARAAFQGHDRAAFALGKLLADGKALPRNPALAAFWLTRAADTIPAAQDSLAELDMEIAGTLNAPKPLTFQFVEKDGERRAHMAWLADPGPKGAKFRVEVADIAPDGGPGHNVARMETRAGAAALTVPDDVANPIWRVMMVHADGEEVAATGWIDPKLRPVAATGMNSVLFETEFGNDRARRAAQKIANGLRSAGLKVAFGGVSASPEVSSVRYRHDADAGLARDVAQFLPALGPSNVAHDPSLEALPGEIVVRLAFDMPRVQAQSDN